MEATKSPKRFRREWKWIDRNESEADVAEVDGQVLVVRELGHLGHVLEEKFLGIFL